MNCPQNQTGSNGWHDMRPAYCFLPGSKPIARPMRRIWCKRRLSNPGDGSARERRHRWDMCTPRSATGRLIWPGGTNRRAEREVAAHLDGPQYWFDSGAEERERHMLIQQAIGRLPVMYRDVVTLKVWGGLTFDEIAESLKIPANTAASRYRYGLAELRKLTKEVLA